MMIIRKIHNTQGCSRFPLVTKLIFALTLILAFSNFAVSVASADGVKIGTVVIELTPKNEEIFLINLTHLKMLSLLMILSTLR